MTLFADGHVDLVRAILSHIADWAGNIMNVDGFAESQAVKTLRHGALHAS
jgi:hypothetical protein